MIQHCSLIVEIDIGQSYGKHLDSLHVKIPIVWSPVPLTGGTGYLHKRDSSQKKFEL